MSLSPFPGTVLRITPIHTTWQWSRLAKLSANVDDVDRFVRNSFHSNALYKIELTKYLIETGLTALPGRFSLV